MSITIASWIVFSCVALSALAGYYASMTKATTATLFPLAILWFLKTVALGAFGFYYNAWGLLAWAILDIFITIGAAAHLQKETKNVG
jgi:hypothetical protein